VHLRPNRRRNSLRITKELVNGADQFGGDYWLAKQFVNLVLLPDEVVLLGQIFTEQLRDGGNEWSCTTSEVGRYA
jgi:hypothetical protein